jgi:hypothetical protein
MREYTSKKRVNQIVNTINRMCEKHRLYNRIIRTWGKMNNGFWCFKDINNKTMYDPNMRTKEVLPFLFGYFHAIKPKEITEPILKEYYDKKFKETP